jgi:transcriptional regulator with XRE-family HTH domain
LSAAELAQSAGCTKAQILAYEAGRQTPEPQRIRALAEALGVHPLALAVKGEFEMSLTELRRGCGYRTRDVVDRIKVSPKVYRRFEVEGLAPARRPNLIFDVAFLLEVRSELVDRALSRSPRVHARVKRMAEVLQGMRVQHVVNPEPWCAPEAGDPLVRELAAHLARSPSSIARVTASVFGRERTRTMRVDQDVLTGIYGLRPERRAAALRAVDRSNTVYKHEIDALPSRLDRFFRFAMSSGMLAVMSRLSDQWTQFNRTGISPETIRMMPPEYVNLRSEPLNSRLEIRLSRKGINHLRQYRDWYAALYPRFEPDLFDLDIRRAVAPRMPQASAETD